MQAIFLKAWQKQALWLWFLLPLAWLYAMLSWLNKKLYQHGLKKVYYPSVPLIVIGNITVGGSGKTPLIINFVQYLQQKNIRVGVISRGYGGDSSLMPRLVTLFDTPKQVGDEPCLIVQTTGVAMSVCPNRGQAIDLLLQHYPDLQIILADDGLQHHALDRDKNWIVVDSVRGFGNRQRLPVGFLREPISRLHEPNTSVIYHVNDNTKQNFINVCTMQLAEQPLQGLFDKQQTLAPQQVIAMTGIGYPQRFFNSLEKLGFDLLKKPLPDHHDFSLSDFDNLPDLPIILTEKDAVKVRLLLQDIRSQNQEICKLANKIWVLPVNAVLNDKVYQILDKQLNDLLGNKVL